MGSSEPEKAAEAQRKKMKRGRERLSDYYVRRLLKCHPERPASGGEVPARLINANDRQLMIVRSARKNAEELRDELAQTFAQPKAGEIKPSEAAELANLAGR